MNKITTRILNYFDEINNDNNHRFKSWEHCFEYFSQPTKQIDEKIACLHLSFYLASWGMYRGSSFILQKDYLIHLEVVKIILEYKELQNINFNNISLNSKELSDMFELIQKIVDWYPNNIKRIEERNKNINVTDTLVTKIILGTLGYTPAYDRYFNDGLKEISINKKLSKNNFFKLIQFYQNNKIEFDNAQNSILQKSGIKYPIMKLIDMYFWSIGFENSK